LSRILQISGYFNTISDAIILLLPVPAIWNLRLRLRKKIAVWAVLTLGAVLVTLFCFHLTEVNVRF
jgi:hypothetical protein